MSTHDRPRRSRGRSGGFTLVELLVVIVIIGILTGAIGTAVVTSLNEREINEAAGVFQATMVVSRDTAARTGNNTGIRLLIDPDLTNTITGTIVANRMISIVQAPDYNGGTIHAREVTWVINPTAPLPNQIRYTFLVAFEQKLDPNIATPQIDPTYQPTSWYWNIRQGEKIRLNSSGRAYTIAGPIKTASRALNPERFLNGDDPTTPNTKVVSLPRLPASYPSPIVPPNLTPTGGPFGFMPPQVISNVAPILTINNGGSEYLILFNGVDDDGDGFVDEGFDGIDNDGDGVTDPAFDGIDNDGNGVIDDLGELLFGYNPLLPRTGEYEPESLDLTARNRYVNVPSGVTYTISRRAVVAEGAREIPLPDNIVIDMTMLDRAASTASTPNPPPLKPERSRVPLDSINGTVDILFAPNGSVVEDTLGANSLLNNRNLPFYHFWLASKSDVFGIPSTAIDQFGRVITSPQYQSPQVTILPTPYSSTSRGGPLKGERRMVTLLPKTGLVTINSIEDFSSIDAPFLDAQTGVREP